METHGVTQKQNGTGGFGSNRGFSSALPGGQVRSTSESCNIRKIADHDSYGIGIRFRQCECDELMNHLARFNRAFVTGRSLPLGPRLSWRLARLTLIYLVGIPSKRTPYRSS